nr:GNAT family N-acetyltransferase [Arthrobacter celericrescens]
MDFTVRPPRPGDAGAMAAMHFQAWQESYGHLLSEKFFAERKAHLPQRIEQYRTFIAGPNTWAVADVGGELVGLAAAGPGPDEDRPGETALFMLYALQRVHGTGVGQALLDAVIGREAAYLWVLEDNPRAQAFYRRNGFVPDGRRELLPPEWEELPEIRMVRPAVGG